MKENSKIYIAGHKGLVGSAIHRCLQSNNFNNIVISDSKSLDLRNESNVRNFFNDNKPEYVFICAAKVGGIHANKSYPVEFYLDNVLIQNNIIKASYEYGVKRILFLGSSCIYPKLSPQPIKEEYFMSGKLEVTNSAYAIAKIGGIELCRSFNSQYGTNYLCVMPTNLYGPGDNFHLENSHVLPAMIRKFHDAKANNLNNVILWGSGKPKREFLYSDDLAEACYFLMNLSDKGFSDLIRTPYGYPIINIGYGDDISIFDLANLVSKCIGFDGEVLWDDEMPDGTPRKLLCSDKIRSLGWKPKKNLIDGISDTYKDFLTLALQI